MDATELIWLGVMLITHVIAYYLGANSETERVQMYDTYLKWEHEKWLEEHKKHD